ncbi:MAG TPA: universal stress protein [Polyangiales bacterium]|jgi:nucleotide-binding universal stress UspA family protein|nr:universal stress protein [Polyangiales bacterium]
MFKPKQILVPTDFSPSAWNALEDAAAIAATYGASLDVIHAWDIPTFAVPGEMAGYALPDTVIDTVSAQAQHMMEELLSQVRAKAVAIRNASVVPGNAGRAIVEVARGGSYDLIVIGSHGRTGLARAMLGSVAERVVRHAPCPVLVVTGKPRASIGLAQAEVPNL